MWPEGLCHLQISMRVGNRTRELPAFKAVSVTTVPTRAPHMTSIETILIGYKCNGFLGRDAMRFGLYVPTFRSNTLPACK